ncbi:hypothetical protein TNIN_87291 [Trichonephila inaurata madagascariensis]|uniref:Uncharacterized protein n=1 Tax=Trichonephila inaurata madagascariensis TaxID=2747483 RepID=A0A8X6YM12_9ARAC|nr:hypothetical protein TNIN_87291 [Trichonephila inaurata madagascariensis]
MDDLRTVQFELEEKLISAIRKRKQLENKIFSLETLHSKKIRKLCIQEKINNLERTTEGKMASVAIKFMRARRNDHAGNMHEMMQESMLEGSTLDVLWTPENCQNEKGSMIQTQIGCSYSSTDSIEKKNSDERPPKKSKDSSNKAHSSSNHHKSKYIPPDPHQEIPKPLKNDALSRFSSFVEPYCADITQDMIRAQNLWKIIKDCFLTQHKIILK